MLDGNSLMWERACCTEGVKSLLPPPRLTLENTSQPGTKRRTETKAPRIPGYK